MGVAGVAGGVVLAGGRSTRMGTAKAAMEWHGSTLLFRAAAIVARSVDGPVVVVAAPGQDLPPLPPGVSVAFDPVEGLGPMQGLAVGLAALEAGTAFVCSTDLPFLHPAYVRRVLGAFTADVDVVLPVARGFRQPLAAAYRTRIAGRVAELLAEGNHRPGMIFQHCAVSTLDDKDLLSDKALAELDPELDSVLNVNTPEDYAAALARPSPEVVVGQRTVRAATLAETGLPLDRLEITLNGAPVPADGRLPLVTGDRVTVHPLS